MAITNVIKCFTCITCTGTLSRANRQTDNGDDVGDDDGGQSKHRCNCWRSNWWHNGSNSMDVLLLLDLLRYLLLYMLLS